MNRIQTIIIAVAAGLAFLSSAVASSVSVLEGRLQLARDGDTAYQVVLPAKPTAVDHYGIAVLTDTLAQMTGAAFPVVAPSALDPGRPGIFIGVSAPVVERLHGRPLDWLAHQEHAARSLGLDIFLHGEGPHGNLHAILDFVRYSLGRRWYSVYVKPDVPERPGLSLAPFARTRGFSFRSREVALRWELDFYFQQGMNMAFDRRTADLDSPFLSYIPNDKFVHSSFAYIPPNPDAAYAKTFDWLERYDYFETDPEFFSLNHAGHRVPRQLCFSNPGLRAELTRNILSHVERTPANNMITLDAADAADTFCYCKGCLALEEKHGSPGGPLYDYLFELCALLAEPHPETKVKTLAYRRAQTQKPPVLPVGERLPDNLVIHFAPIEDSFFADWTHPDSRIQESFADLQAWSRITPEGNLWAWLYPNPWGSGAFMPVGNLRRVINNMRLMHQVGVRGIFTDHNGFIQRSGLSELQSYLIYRLAQDIHADTDAILRDFTDRFYGPAASRVRTYLDELEKGRETMDKLPPGVTFTSGQRYDDETFPYLTLENLARWQRDFDRMEALVEADSEEFLNLRILRRELDLATLWKWLPLHDADPEYFSDYATLVNRIEAVNHASAPAGQPARPLGEAAMADFVAVIKGGGQQLPLPAVFDEIDPSRIQQLLPANTARRLEVPRQVVDPEAAFGYAVSVHNPDLPFKFGFFQWQTRQPPKGVSGPRKALDLDQITPNVYQLYELGTVEITPDCFIWFSAQSWATHLQAGSRLFEPGSDNLWNAWVSLKFEGPRFGGEGDRDLVLVDRIILVRKGAGQFGE